MKARCPHCGGAYDFEHACLDNDLRAMLECASRLGRNYGIVAEYLELFEGVRPSRPKKMRRLIEEVESLLQKKAFTVRRETYRISTEGICASLREVCNRSPRGLRNHNYLKAVMKGVAESEEQSRLVEADRTHRVKEERIRSGARDAGGHASNNSAVGGLVKEILEGKEMK